MVSRDTFNTFIAVYMMASRRHGTLYVGVTSRLPTRVSEHRDGLVPGFTKTYGVKRLVWFETFELMTSAIHREKQIKKYRREWKINLIERDNPHWDDLYPSLFAPRVVEVTTIQPLPPSWPGLFRPPIDSEFDD